MVTGLEVMTEVTMKNNVFWDVSPCSLVEVSSFSAERMDIISGVEESTSQQCFS
jgi:hypothetical protein